MIDAIGWAVIFVIVAIPLCVLVLPDRTGIDDSDYPDDDRYPR